VACRTTRPKRELVRIVRAPGGAVALDATGRAPGRGAYLCRDAACWTTAARRRALERALGVSIPDHVANTLIHGPDPVPGDPTQQPAPAGPAPGVERDAAPADSLTGGAHGQE
jgi:uncharacterized protein